MDGLAGEGRPDTMSITSSERVRKRLLLIACDYDADLSPQGLRWVKLSRELVRLGWDIDVLTWQARGGANLSPHGPFPGALNIYPVYPGPYHALIGWLQQRRRAAMAAERAGDSAVATRPAREGAMPKRLNWKGRVDAMTRSALGAFMYPDLRREGLPFLRARVRRQLSQRQYAAVVLSHEPPFALELLDAVRAAGVPAIVDLGDPVRAVYTPARWHARASKLEAKVCALATAVVVTTCATARMLTARHGRAESDFEVVSQGFDPRPLRQTSAVVRMEETARPLRLVYTGRFYRFRDPRPVLDAVCESRDVQLALALPELPDWLDARQLHGSSIELHLRLSHQASLALQDSADVLLIIGNDDPAQTPGKLFEYLAVPAPILYVTDHPSDEGARLVQSLKRGLVVPSRRSEVMRALCHLQRLRRDGCLSSTYDLSPSSVASYSWGTLARRYSELIARTVSRHM